MGHTIELCYDSVAKVTTITSDGIIFDTQRLNGIDISKWVYPFYINGVKWYGLYEELKNFYTHRTFTIIFDGAYEDYIILKNAMKDKNIEVKERISKVIILYDGIQFVTKITINGKIFDTQRIEKRSIDEWVLPFSYKAADWKGIFGEIEDHLGNSFYSISFAGNQEDMKILIDNAPDNINIYYKPPLSPEKKKQAVTPKAANDVQAQNTVAVKQDNTVQRPDINDVKGGVKGLISGTKNDFKKMKENNSGLLMFGEIAAAVAVLGCILFIIKMSRLFMLISLVPAIVFAILAFKDKYKSIAIVTFIVCGVLAVVSWIIITIRWRILWGGVANEINDAMDSMNDALDMLG